MDQALAGRLPNPALASAAIAAARVILESLRNATRAQLDEEYKRRGYAPASPESKPLTPDEAKELERKLRGEHGK